ncbi:MAG TPA: YihY/virulence factor BrkB family protein [Acidimicrobiales bacterium]|jgi:inner membrane protein YhjD|nr:YihY/virulence factor BrkB family protein [Acidimicrobiales bacterium]
MATETEAAVAEEPRGGPLGAIDRFQQRHTVLAFPVGVVRKFGDDRAGRLAALIAYYGFFSLFPLLMVATTIIGFVFEDKEADELQDSIIAEIPVIGSQIAGQANELNGSIVALLIGLGVALWAGLGCMQAAQDAMNEVWDVPRLAHPSFVAKRLRSLLTLAVLAGALIISTFSAQVISILDDLPGAARIGGAILSVGINVALFLVVFKVLTTGPITWKQLLPGAILGGIGYGLLQYLGTWYVERTISGAADTYGTFAVVIGLLSWLFLLGQLTVFAAEVNVVATRRLWPRSLFPPKLTAADKEVLAAEVTSQQMRPEQDISVDYVEDRPRPK